MTDGLQNHRNRIARLMSPKGFANKFWHNDREHRRGVAGKLQRNVPIGTHDEQY